MTIIGSLNPYAVVGISKYISLIIVLIIIAETFLICVGQNLDLNNADYESLKPIDTFDGRRVINANGLQFEIPSYASGISDIQQPSTDLLPPFADGDFSLSTSYKDESTTFQELVTSTPFFEKISLNPINTESHKYTGKFGGPNGVLTPSTNQRGGIDGSYTQAVYTTVNSVFPQTPTTTGTRRANTNKFTGSFGGPPGILVPYDSLSSSKLFPSKV